MFAAGHQPGGPIQEEGLGMEGQDGGREVGGSALINNELINRGRDGLSQLR